MKAQTIDLNKILQLEDARLKEINSVATYIEELAWFRSLIDHHLNRCTRWDRDSEKAKKAYGKLHDFLEGLES